MTHAELVERLHIISEKLNDGKQFMDADKIIEFQHSASEIEKKLDGILTEGRLLRLGIVGEVKAGKSSFLNALLFDGKDILPKAPTPMTAALTRIQYNETPQAKIVFYSKNDWDIVIENAKRYDMELQKRYNEYCMNYDNMLANSRKREQASLFGNPLKNKSEQTTTYRTKSTSKVNEQNAQNAAVEKKFQPKKTFEVFENEIRNSISLVYKSCKELIEMTEKSGLDVKRYLDHEEVIKGENSGEKSFIQKMNQYVGADGIFTPIVKYTELQIDNPMLEGIEVIDTPGLNDPILSRGRITQDFLVECDAVFLVGYCGQFLGADDMSLILSSLPDGGIKKAVLIGSKFDSAILQYNVRRSSFQAAYLGTLRNCEDQARENIEKCSGNSRNAELIAQIRNSLPPICVSSLTYSAGRKLQKHESLDALESFAINNLKTRFNDFNADVETLIGLSNIPDVRDNVFESTKADKEKIISDRINTLIDSQKYKFLELLEDIFTLARTNQNDLKKYDVDELQQKIENMKERLDSVRVVVKSLFQNAGTDSRRSINDIIINLGREMGNHDDIEVHDHYQTKHHSSTSGHLWWKSTDHWDEHIETHSCNISDVEKNIKDYFYQCIDIINANFKRLLKIDQLKNNVKSAVLSAFDQCDKDFDENRIILPLEEALNRISIPQVDMKYQKYIEALESDIVRINSNGAVKNENIPKLKVAQGRVFDMISNDLTDYLRKEAQNIDNMLQTEAATFVDGIVKQLNSNMQKIQKLFDKKQENLQKFDAFIATMEECKQLMQG